MSPNPGWWHLTITQLSLTAPGALGSCLTLSVLVRNSKTNPKIAPRQYIGSNFQIFTPPTTIQNPLYFSLNWDQKNISPWLNWISVNKWSIVLRGSHFYLTLHLTYGVTNQKADLVTTSANQQHFTTNPCKAEMHCNLIKDSHCMNILCSYK